MVVVENMEDGEGKKEEGIKKKRRVGRTGLSGCVVCVGGGGREWSEGEEVGG